MKSFFTKLGTLLLCGVAVAVVGCTDFSQDIQAVDQRVDKLTEATAENLSKAISGLETQLKADLAALQTTHNADITKLTSEIDALEDALEAAENAHATDKAAAEKALADLQTALANAKTALESEIAAVKAELEKEIADADAVLQAGINENAEGVAANKALIEGLTTQLTALEATVDAIDERLTDTEADVKALQDELAAFKGDYQTFYSQVVNTIQNHDNALATLKNELEAGDAAVKAYVDQMVEELTKKIETVEQTLTSVKNLLDDEVAARIEGDEELNKLIETTQQSLTAALNLIADETEARKAEDVKIQEYIAGLEERLQNKLFAVDQSLADLNDGLDSLRQELSEEFAAQIEVVQGAVSSLLIQHNELVETVNGLDAALKAQAEALEAMKEVYEAKMAELDETDTDLYNQYETLQEIITSLNNHITDLQAEDEALATSINGVQEALTQYMNLDALQTAELKKELEGNILEKFNMLITLLNATEERLTSKINHIFDRVIANEIKIADLEEQTAALEEAVQQLKDAHALLTSQLDEALRRVNGQLEQHGEDIDDLKNAHALLTSQLDDAIRRINGQIETLEEAIEDNKDAIAKNGASIEANKELIAENAADIIETNTVIAELQAAFEAYKKATDAQIQYLWNNDSSIAENLAKHTDKLMGLINKTNASLDETQKNLTAAIGRIDALEDAVATIQHAYAVLIDGLRNKFGATDKDIVDLQDAIDALEKALDEEVKKLYDNDQKNLDNLSNRLASHTDKLAQMIYALEDRMDVAEGKIADLEEQTAALEEAVQQLKDAHALLTSQLDEALRRVNGQLEQHGEDIDDLRNAHALLTSQLDDAIRRINGQIETLEEAIEDNKDAIAKNGASIEANKDLIAKNAALIADNATAIATLQAAFEAYKKQTNQALLDLAHNQDALGENLANNIHKVMGIIGDTNEALAQTQKDLLAAVGRIEVLAEAVETIKNLYATKEYVDQIDSDLRDKINGYYDAITRQLDAAILTLTIANDQNTADIANLKNTIAEANELIKGLRGDVDELLARVQSIVYVPEYNDHKATLDWAFINSTDGFVVAPKNTVLKYRVHAVANEDAAKAAADIAAAWKSELATLYYSVETVKVRGTEVGLNIVDVKAVGENLEVTVLSDNFSDAFYLGYFGEDFVSPVSREDNEQKVMEAVSYSASLVLTDGNNNRTTEYTNLVPNAPFELTMKLYIPESTDDVDAAGLRMAKDDEVIEYLMPCNDTENVETAVAPIVGFISTDEEIMAARPASQPYFSEDELVALGYDVEVSKAAHILAGFTIIDRKDEGVDTYNVSPYFTITEDPEFDYSFRVKPNVSFENVGKKNSVKYEYTFNGAKSTLTYDFVLANAQVAVNMEVSKQWTIAIMNSVFEGKHYAKSYNIPEVKFEAVGGPVSHLKPVLNDPAVVKEGYPKYYVKNAEGEWVEATDRSFRLAKFNDDATVDIEMIGGTYSWNNSYKIVWVSTNDVDNVDYTTTAIVNLVGKPEKIDVTIPVNFTLSGTNSFFAAEADLCGKAYEQLAKYIGLEDDDADLEFWNKIFKSYVTRYNALELNMPVVNGETSKWIANLDQLATAKLFIGKNKINEKEANVITWSVTPWWGVPINYTVTGNITLPTYDFIYSEDYVNIADKTATVYGQIEGGKYSIIKSDLAKYFNIDAKSLNGHNYDVRFKVVAPVATAEQEVLVGPQTTTPVVEKGTATYHYLTSDFVVLDWNTYRGLKVNVEATLFVNGYELEMLPLTLVTKDPITITGTDYNVERELRKDLKVQVFQNLVLTSSIKPDDTKENLIQFKNSNGTVYDLTEAMAYSNGVYGANLKVVLGEKGVYYYNSAGKLIMLGSNKYKYYETTGFLEIYGDDAQVKKYYADFTAILDSRICGGDHKVPFRVTATLTE